MEELSVAEVVKQSTTIDNPVFLEAAQTVYELADSGTFAGFEDALSGKPKQQHMQGTPALFILAYNKAYEKGESERNDRLVAMEIAREESHQGHCSEASTNSTVPEVPSTLTDRDEHLNQVPAVKEQSPGRKILGYIVACTITGVFAGLIGFSMGKKKAMVEKRDLGIGNDQTGSGR